MKVVLIAGSNRRQSSSTQLIRHISSLLEKRNCETEVVDLYLQPLPLFNPDSDHSDKAVIKLKDSVQSADAIVLASPEYHGGMTGVLKNALDYLKKEHVAHKLVLSVTSAGGAVGTSCLIQMQTTVRYVHGLNCPEWISIGKDQKSFNSDGEPEHEAVKQRIERVIEYFLNLAKKACIQ